MNRAYFTAWAEAPASSRRLCISISSAGSPLRSSVSITEDDARRLIRELEAELDKLPSVATAADLGIEGAPV